MDSELGRFISEDQAQDGLNWYIYAANNPLIFIDPTGNEIEAVSIALTNMEKVGYATDPVNNQTITDSNYRQQLHQQGESTFKIYQSILMMQPEIYNNKELFELTSSLTAYDSEGMSQLRNAVDTQLGKELGQLRGDRSSKFINTLADFAPGLGDYKGIVEGTIGYNAVGEKLAGWERALSVMCLSEVKDSIKGAKLLGKIDEISGLNKFWKGISEFKGLKVYQRADLIDPSLVDDIGRTNLQRMKIGLAPIGPDGKSINLHHMIQTADGPIAEVTQTFHQKYKKIIHINPNTIPSGINRTEFEAWKKEYWKNRALDFE